MNKINIVKLLIVGCMTFGMFSSCQQKKQSDSQDEVLSTNEHLNAEPRQIPNVEVLEDLRQPDVKVHVKRGQALAMQTEGLTLTAIDAAVQHEAEYSVTSLVEDDLPPSSTRHVEYDGIFCGISSAAWR